MIEALLQHSGPFREDTGNVLFLFDPETGTDLMGSTPTVAYTNSAGPDAFAIRGKPTYALPNTNAGLTITLATPLNLQGKNWTLEWSTYNTGAFSAYAWELGLVNASAGIQARYGNSGFGSRLQVGTNFRTVGAAWNPPVSNASTLNVLKEYALVCKNNAISMFVDGKKQKFANGTGSVYNTDSFAPADDLSGLTRIIAGFQGSTVPAVISKHGRIRISDFARYTRDYEPKLLEMV
jgi:hypothetical protein